MDIKFIDDNYVGTQKEKDRFKNNFYKALHSGNFDSGCPELYDFLHKYMEKNPQIEKKKSSWYDAISDKVKAQNQHIVDECVEFAKEEKIDVKFFYNGLRCYVDKNSEVITDEFKEMPFGEPYIGIKIICEPQNAFKFDVIIGKYCNGYVECWDNYFYYFAECHGADKNEFNKFKEATENITQKYIYQNSSDIPQVLKFIQDIWSERCRYTGDGGSCVIGEGIEFTFGGQSYKMPPCSPYQGEFSWTYSVPLISKLLETIGADEIHMDYGRMD